MWNHDYLYGQLSNWNISKTIQGILMKLFQRLGQESNLNFTCSPLVYLSVWWHPAGREVAWMTVLKKSCTWNSFNKTQERWPQIPIVFSLVAPGQEIKHKLYINFIWWAHLRFFKGIYDNIFTISRNQPYFIPIEFGLVAAE